MNPMMAAVDFERIARDGAPPAQPDLRIIDEAMTLEQAKEWYQNLASNMDRAGVKIRLFNDYPTVTNEEEAFVLAVKDQQAKKPLPEKRVV